MKKSALKRKKGINPVSDKERERQKLRLSVKTFRISELVNKYGRAICEYCGEPEGTHELWKLDGHHIDGNRNNNDVDNFFICHRICHSYITDHNIKVEQEGFQGYENNKV